DVYQVNLTHPLFASGDFCPRALYERVRRFRAPFGGCVDLSNQTTLVANSPERFLKVHDGRVESRPIKGTAPLATGGPALSRSAKDRAEHVMIVDLMRNDLGRICDTGSVAVEGLCRVVEYPTLYHLVTTVSGRLRAGTGLPELLRATFPGGSVTGAPKVR